MLEARIKKQNIVQNLQMKNRTEIYQKLNELTSYNDFIEVLLILCDKNLNCYENELATRDLKSRLNENEIIFLFGLWAKNKNKRNGIYTDKLELSEIIHKLMDDLHLTFLSDFKSIDLLSINSLSTYHQQIRKNPAAIKETIFYSGSGAYDYQLINFVVPKYELDNDWILKNMKFSTKDLQRLYTYIKSVLNYKINFKRDKLNTIELYSLSRDNYVFKKNPVFITILDTLSFEIEEMLNENFNDIGDLNHFRFRPVIRSGSKYIIPFPYLLSESIYDGPFYWMLDDKKYKSTALKNRGDCAEKIVKSILERKIKKENIFLEVNVNVVKTETVTDLDVCIVCENKMLIFQVKSKRLTQLSKNGDIESFHNDFKLAVIDANKQATTPIPLIISNSCKLKSKISGVEIDCSKITEIYSACIVLDSYPAITTHTRMFFYDGLEEMPVAINIFDLEVILDYVTGFDMLFDYIKKRAQFSKYYIAETELSFFAKYMKSDLKRMDDSDLIYLDNDFAQNYDSDYYLPLMKSYEKEFPSFISSIGRNDYCFCGSGNKLKKCCIDNIS